MNKKQEIMKKQIITVFGNETEAKDNLAVRLVPDLQRRFPKIEFRINDPTESLEPPSDLWIILDVGQGIKEVTVVTGLKQLDYVKGSSVHDFDVYLELKLKEKLGKLRKICLILLPHDMEAQTAYKQVVKLLATTTSTRR